MLPLDQRLDPPEPSRRECEVNDAWTNGELDAEFVAWFADREQAECLRRGPKLYGALLAEFLEETVAAEEGKP